MMKFAQDLVPSVVLALAAAACALAALACAPAARPATPTTGDLPLALVRFKAATGGAAWDRVPAIASHATLTVGSLAGGADSIEDVRTGRFRTTVHLGAFAQSDGFDGRAAWQQTMDGEVVTSDTPDAIAHVHTDRWLTARGYFQPGTARYRDLGAASLAGTPAHGLEATPDGGAPVELWFDDARGLLVRTVTREGSERTITTLDDYRPIDGISVAFSSVQDVGDPRNLTTAITTELHVRPASEAELARPATDGDRVSFAGGARDSQVAFELVNNHIYIHAEVDGQPVRMLVDTGGLNLLTPAAAARLGLSASGKLAMGGAGEAKADVAFARGHALTVGAVRLAAPVFYVVDFTSIGDVEGEDFDGLIGFEIFQRLAVRLDYPARQLTLMARDGWTPPTGAIAVPFELTDRTPVVVGAVDGLPARFAIDTGARNSLTIDTPFARAHDLDAKYHATFETVTGWGVGGGSRGKPVRFHEVRLGGAVIADVAGDLSTSDKGAFANPDLSGNIGGGILKRFVVTFDYRARTMYLAPAAAPVARDVYDRAGMFFMYVPRTERGDHEDRVLRVAAVTPGGPAAKAGVVEGDRIVAIDGGPIARQPLWKWRAILAEGTVGDHHQLTLERAGARRDVTLTLTELVP
jgi:predicted aspartyl protease